ncbi:MAG: zinc ribbon domain-containing protein [Clostridia bacterium]|nr:zinc ribbon domain-containing protein [Clostridia bacterium]
MMYCTKCDKELDTKFCPYCGSETEPIVTKEESIDNKSLIDNLYALRAGLSKVSLEMDKVKKTEHELTEKRSKNQEIEYSSRNSYNFFGSKCDEIDRKYRSENDFIKGKKDKLEEELSKHVASFNHNKKDSITGLIVIFAVIVICSIAAIISSNANDYTVELIANIFLYAPMLVGIFFGLGTIFITKWVLNDNNKIKSLRDEISKLDSQLFNDDEIIEHLNTNKNYVEMHEKFIIAEKQLGAVNNFDYSPYELAIVNQKKKCSMFYKEFHSSYLANFTSILDERDWKNLDLIIFILETHRADTLKEALQQVDMYRHTEKIARAIENASLAICNTIRQESDRITTAIGNCIDTINSRLQIIADNQSVLSKKLNSVNDNIQKSINATELQNALIAKSNETSEQMAMDIARIREFEGRSYGHI